MEQLNRRGLSSYSGSLSLFLFLLLTGFSVSASASASTSISDGIFGDRASIGRNLLQAKTSCPVNFESANYTIITSQCKGPQYPANLCCAAFAQFACPFAAELNDLTNNCATTMFSYIDLHGQYPPGLFSSQCRDSKAGVSCPATPPTPSANDSGSPILYGPRPLVVLTTGFLLLLLRFF